MVQILYKFQIKGAISTKWKLNSCWMTPRKDSYLCIVYGLNCHNMEKQRTSLSHYISHLTALDQREAVINPSAVTSHPLHEQVPLYCKGQSDAWVKEINLGAGIQLKPMKLLCLVKGRTHTTAVITFIYLQ